MQVPGVCGKEQFNNEETGSAYSIGNFRDAGTCQLGSEVGQKGVQTDLRLLSSERPTCKGGLSITFGNLTGKQFSALI